MAGIKQIGTKDRVGTAKPKKTKKPRKARAKNQDRWIVNHLENHLG